MIVTTADRYRKIFSRRPALSDIRPSLWAEKNIVIPGGKGKVNYDFNPYCREIIDELAPDSPIQIDTVMKGSQITFSSGVIYPYLGYTIKEDPANTYLMVGTQELVKLAGEKLDQMISGAKLLDYIGYSVQRKRNTKSGDTDEIKYFPNGFIKVGSPTNAKSIAQVDLKKIILDDADAMRNSSKDAGNILDLLMMRSASDMMGFKLLLVGTPLLKATSILEPEFLKGDQRRYFVECPCCHEPIIFKWEVREGDLINSLTGETAAGNGGVYWRTDNHDTLIQSSVGYVCYKCAGFFDDRGKQKQLREGSWIPTAHSKSPIRRSRHISSLYAPEGMYNWSYYAEKYIEANLPGQPRDERKMQTLVNTCWGETYEGKTESPKATQIQSNLRPYRVGTLPVKLMEADGNGGVALITFAADLNGTVDDARVDWEIVAHSYTGATYSVAHGSVGTFVPRENTLAVKADRKAWTYRHGHPGSVWSELERIIYADYVGDDGLYYAIGKAGIDIGHLSDYVWEFIDNMIRRHPHNPPVGLRGNKEEKYKPQHANVKLYEVGKARNDAYYLQVGYLKDMLAGYMQMDWNERRDGAQPANFMNFPTPDPEKRLYLPDTYFSHYESEQRSLITDPKDGSVTYRWVKVNTAAQNHYFDVRIYGLALREIMTTELGKQLTRGKEDKAFGWPDFVKYVTEG